MHEQGLFKLLQTNLRWVPDPKAPRQYRPEPEAAERLRLRPHAVPGQLRYTLLVDGVVRELDMLPAAWVIVTMPPATGDPPETLPYPVEEAIFGLRRHDPEARQAAAWRLGALGDRRALPALERMALTDRGYVTIEGAFVDDSKPIYPDAVDALRALYDFLGVTAEDVARLTELLHAPESYPNDARHVLALGGEAMRPVLREALTSSDSQTVIRAASALAVLREPGAGIAQLAHPDPEVRRAAIGLGEPDVWGASWLSWPPDDWHDAILARLSIEPEPALRILLAKFLIQYGKDNPYGKGNPADMPAALRCRNDPDPGVRGFVAQRLHWFHWREFGPALPALAEEALAWAREETEPAIRSALLHSAPLLPYAPAATEWLIEQLRGSDRKTRAAAAARLADAEPSVAVEPLLLAADTPDSALRRAALDSLAQMGEVRALRRYERERAADRMLPSERKDLIALIRRVQRQKSRARR